MRILLEQILGHTTRAKCSFCKKAQNAEVIESEQHMWLDCVNSGQAHAWETAENTWRKTSNREWPIITLGLIRGSATLTYEKDFNKDSERIRILISMTIWAIWKSKIKNSINDQDVTIHETSQVLKELISDLIRNSWNATLFMAEEMKVNRQRDLQKLWADGRLTDFGHRLGPKVDFT